MNERLLSCAIDLRRAYIDGIPERFELKYAESKPIGICERITDAGLFIGLLDNGQIKPQRLLIKGSDNDPLVFLDDDNQVIASLKYPGKSAFLYLDDSADREVVGELTRMTLKREPDRRDKLHLASVGDIESAGWQAWWTPLPSRDNYMHVRLIPNCIVKEGRKPDIFEAEKLKNAFVKVA